MQQQQQFIWGIIFLQRLSDGKMHDIADRRMCQSSPTFDARKNILYAAYNRGIIGVTSKRYFGK